MKRNFDLLSFIVMATLLFTLASCGSNDDDGGSSSAGTPTGEQEEAQTDQGTYRAVLAPMNTSVAGSTSGTVEVIISGDDVRVTSNVVGAPEGVKHHQNIMFGASCPDLEASDTNSDSFIDINEITPATGQILLPLDSDLSAQLDGMDFGPIANGSGNYVYRRSTSFAQLMGDLETADPDPNDFLVKLSPGQALNLSNRVVIIHGVSSISNLPDSVATVGTMSNSQSLPIACGKLVRVTEEISANEEAGI